MKTFYAALLIISSAVAQIKTVSIEQIQLPKTEAWSNPSFSPSGKEIFLTNADYNGIWQYSLETKLLKEITRDRHSGFNFSVSPDGMNVAYRRTVDESNRYRRVQESVVLNMTTSEKQGIESGASIAVPVFIQNTAVTPQKVKGLQKNSTVLQQGTAILGIEDTKISLLHNGTITSFDPLKDGQYIWPVLSPDGLRIAAVEMERGTFVCDVNGENIVPLGKCNAPNWTRDGKWIVGMDDRDDGHQILSSDIVAISIDGKQKISLTENSNVTAMYPYCSSTENKIVFNTLNGDVYVLSYEEIQ